MSKLPNIIVLMIFLIGGGIYAQEVPSKEENIPYLVTFGKGADKSYGDDDYNQTFFFVLPENYNKAFYIKVFDPGVGGAYDEKVGEFDTQTKFSVYGGKGCISNKDARKTDPVGNYKSGTLLGSKTFGKDDKYDGKWYTFGPFDPKSGEKSSMYNGYVFKIIAQGYSGDDGNLYKYFLSTDKARNVAIEGANAFTFEYTFRLHDDKNQVAHLYPFISNKVVAVKVSNFDWDEDGDILVYSTAVIGKKLRSSDDKEWAIGTYLVKEEEKGGSLDIRFVKNQKSPQENNNVVVHVTNQYGENLPFYSAPIGGVPKFKPDIDVRIIE